MILCQISKVFYRFAFGCSVPFRTVYPFESKLIIVLTCLYSYMITIKVKVNCTTSLCEEIYIFFANRYLTLTLHGAYIWYKLGQNHLIFFCFGYHSTITTRLDSLKTTYEIVWNIGQPLVLLVGKGSINLPLIIHEI